jgi:hypothetical protein
MYLVSLHSSLFVVTWLCSLRISIERVINKFVMTSDDMNTCALKVRKNVFSPLIPFCLIESLFCFRRQTRIYECVVADGVPYGSHVQQTDSQVYAIFLSWLFHDQNKINNHGLEEEILIAVFGTGVVAFSI